jgi:hypothetical protein
MRAVATGRDPRQRSVDASLSGIASTVALSSLSSPMVEGASVPSGQRLKALINLSGYHAKNTADSSRPAPKWVPPGDEAVDCVVLQTFDAEGAGPGHVSLSTYRVL